MIIGFLAILFELLLLGLLWTIVAVGLRRRRRFSGLGPSVALIIFCVLAVGTLIQDIREAHFLLQLRSMSPAGVSSVRLPSTAVSKDIVSSLSDSNIFRLMKKSMHPKPVAMIIENTDGSRMLLEIRREGQGVIVENGSLSAYSSSFGEALTRAGVDLPSQP